MYLGWEIGDGSGGLEATKKLVLALVKVRPEAVCRTCCFAGIIESSNFARKSMPNDRGGDCCEEKIKFKVVAGETDGLAAAAPGGD